MQFKRQITFTQSEATRIRDAYAQYLLAGGEDSINKWMKEIIMDKVKE